MPKNNNNGFIRFFCDLDHTLIYSHRAPIGAEKVAVEYLNGKEQSFMTRKTYDFFGKQDLVELIPVTTRSRLQYERITVFRKEIRCKYALICNGGVLLVDGVEDVAWYRESVRLIIEETEELKTLRECIQQISPTSQIHDVCGLYFYIKHNSPQDFSERLKGLCAPKGISICYDRHKVYCMPKVLNKGTAIKRFAQKFGDTMTIAAGDSNFDIPMLDGADVRIAPSGLEGLLPKEGTLFVSDSVFSDGICSFLNTIAIQRNC